MSDNIFITGGNGQDAQILSKFLKKKKKKFYLMVRNKSSISFNSQNIYKIDLKKKKQITKLFKAVKPDIVLHLAANNPSYFEKGKKKFFYDNLEITKNLFDSVFEANHKAKFIFCSSSQIFKKKNGIVNEKSKKNKLTDYTKFRIVADRYMLKFKKNNKINYTNAILFNHDSIYRNRKFILPRLVNCIIKKKFKFIKKILNENIYADFSHAEDICGGIYKLMFSKLNLDSVIFSSNKLTSLNSIILRLLKKKNVDINKFKINSKKPKKNIYGDNLLAQKKLKWKIKKDIFYAADEIYHHFSKN